ncbi:hypothetical protein HanRHA438_Chr12g0549191 [Helianthus annuus]|uniref:Uncharacterized protein n=1 Tax=Helianthus annuus TaxID=4232 RepID=A0A251T175_HELAN|nr:hypothetical protein HanHA300_Chr12g0440921 [Helianthus annuus]KAJ0505042.1 hypothetical protein HanHA89_Chr12g0466021 [Helianthus annuus]KAJ0674727.1 hypothetical protein HanLR1_Chr12g0443151 [Helianthus annuus]KAJ0862433.1 hypothetical protein HanPSC8_Chr12g0518141 [Helianthus annuus]KAJ0866215.1 hypothetical protein HanRHA438_Chr12g0549191 [Helianthus annuus]
MFICKGVNMSLARSCRRLLSTVKSTWNRRKRRKVTGEDLKASDSEFVEVEHGSNDSFLLNSGYIYYTQHCCASSYCYNLTHRTSIHAICKNN